MRGGYRGVVFDMDGVLADSEPVYHEAENAILDKYGVVVTDEQQRAITGFGVFETWDAIAKMHHLDVPLNELIKDYDDDLRSRLAKLTQPLPGVQELLANLRALGIPIGLASSSWPAWIDALLGGLGLQDAFDVKASATMVEHPKPAPDIYILAAGQLGVAPRECIGIEDTPTGLKAVRSAGMLAVQVRSASTAFEPQSDADLVLASLLDFDLTLLDAADSRD